MGYGVETLHHSCGDIDTEISYDRFWPIARENLSKIHVRD